MEAKTISKIQSYINKNPKLNNSELARLIVESGKLGYTEGSLKNYIAKVKAMPAKVVDTVKGNVTRNDATMVYKETDKPKTIQDHINGYLISYCDLSFSALALLMHQNGIGKQYTLGTLRNYIYVASKSVEDTVAITGETSSENLIKKVSNKSTFKITNHEIIIVDTSCADKQFVNDIISNLSGKVENKVTVIAFDETSNVCSNFENSPSINFKQEEELGINLLNSISTAVCLAMNNPKSKEVPTNVTIITSGGDNLSNYLTYNDIRAMLDEVKNNYNWNVNLVFTGPRSEESKRLGLLLGIDSSNTTTSVFSISKAMSNRVNKLVSGNVLIAVDYYGQ